MVNRATGQIDELAAKVRCDQVLRVARQQAWNVIVRQVGFIVIRGCLNHPVQLRHLRLFAYRLHELAMRELETFRRCRDVRAVQSVILQPQARDDLAPRLLGLAFSQRVDLVDIRPRDLEADDALGLLHAAAYRCAAILPPRVEVNLFVYLGNLDPQAPVACHFLDGREVDIAYLAVGRREVTTMGARMLPKVLASAGRDAPSLASTESAN